MTYLHFRGWMKWGTQSKYIFTESELTSLWDESPHILDNCRAPLDKNFVTT